MPEVSRLEGVVAIDGAEDAQAKLAGVQSGFEGAGAAANQSGGAFDTANMSITDLSSALDLAADALQVAGQVYEDTIARAAAWGDEMGDLAQITNSSVEETSRLAGTLELMGVKSDSLGRVVKAMNKEGLEFNLETLLRLNREYNAIQDPVEKTRFLFDKFGKSGADMAEVLGRDEADIRKLAETVDRSGKVIDDAFANKGETWNVNLEILSQRAEGAGIVIGGVLIDAVLAYSNAVTDATEGTARFLDSVSDTNSPMGQFAQQLLIMNSGLADFAGAFEETNTKIDEQTSGLDDGTRAVAAYGARWQAMGTAFEPAMEAAKEAEEYFRKAEEAAEKARQAQDDAWEARFNQSLVGNPMQQENEQFAGSMTDLETKAAELRGEIDRLTESNGKYYETVQGNGATAAELELANQKLAAAYKKLGEETDPLKIAQLNVEIEKQQGFIAGADQVVGGYINNSKKIAELEGDYQVVEDAIEAVKKAHEQATAQIVLDYLMQQLAVGDWTDEEKEAAEKAAKEWGLYEGSMIEVMQTVDQSIKDHGDDANAMVQSITDGINGMPSTKYIDIMVRTNYQAQHQNDMQIGAEPDEGVPVVITPDDGGDGGDFDGAESLNGFSEPSAGGVGGLTINIYETGNPQATANAVIEILQDRGLVDRTLVT